MKKFAVILLGMVVLAACESRRLDNTKALSQEIKATQIKRVTNTQLVYTVDEWGKKISRIAEKSLQKELTAHPETAGETCKDLSRIPLIAALQKEYGVRIELLTATDASNQKLNAKERELLDAYLYSAKNKAAASDNVQQLNDTLLVYNAPIAGDNPTCKACSADPAVPFTLWRLLFDKKEIIRKLDAKMLKE